MKEMKISSKKLIILITIIGGILRFWDLGLNTLWIDEAYFANISKQGIIDKQEYFTSSIVYSYGLYKSEYLMRIMFALAGTLTIPAIWYVVKNQKLEASIFVALFPLFIFWSRMARPYAFMGLFIVLGWRWWGFNLIALWTNPLAIIGVNFIKLVKTKKWIIALLLLSLAILAYLKRPDIGAMSYGVRMLYIPALVGVLYFTEYKK